MKVWCLVMAFIVVSTPAPVVHRPPATRPTTAAQTGTLLTLRLQAGPHAPADLPKGPLFLRVPVYPHAHSRRHSHIMPLGFSLSPYIKESPQVAFLLPADPETAKAWYRQTFSARGYTVQITAGESGNARTGVSGGWLLLDLRPLATPTLDLHLELQGARGGTVAVYQASAVTVPPRAPGSYLTPGVSRVMVRYQFLNATSRRHTVTYVLRARDAITALIRALNAFPRSDEALTSCPVIDRRATLVFYYSGGRFVTVTTAPGCTGVVVDGYPPLAGSIWSLLASLLSPQKRVAGT